MHTWLKHLEDGLFQRSRSMGPPWGGTVRWLRYPAAVIRDWLRGDIGIRAMSLAYTTLLSLVPLLVFSFAILKGIGAHGDMRFIIHEFLRPVGGAATQLTESIMQFVENMRAELLGSIGLAFLVYTVIATIQKVEGSFNFVWRVERRRNFGRRFTEYLSVMILGPILLAVAVALLGSAEHSPVVRWLNAVAPLAAVLGAFAHLLPYALVAAVFTCMYAFIPNAHVQFRAALIGGVTAGIIWGLVGNIYTAVILTSSQMVAVYSGFAIVLTTLIWVYLSWLILLIGAQLAFYVQFPQYLRHGQEHVELTGSDREQAGLTVMYLIGRDYGSGAGSWDAGRLAAELDVPGIALAPVLERLERSGLIVATEKAQFVPGRDPGGILLADILDAVRTLQTSRLPVEVNAAASVAPVMREVHGAMRERLGARSLKDLIAAKEKDGVGAGT
jgi:membrane protein